MIHGLHFFFHLCFIHFLFIFVKYLLFVYRDLGSKPLQVKLMNSQETGKLGLKMFATHQLQVQMNFLNVLSQWSSTEKSL